MTRLARTTTTLNGCAKACEFNIIKSLPKLEPACVGSFLLHLCGKVLLFFLVYGIIEGDSNIKVELKAGNQIKVSKNNFEISRIDCIIEMESGARITLSDEQHAKLVRFIQEEIFSGKKQEVAKTVSLDEEIEAQNKQGREKNKSRYTIYFGEEARNIMHIATLPKYSYAKTRAIQKHARKYGRTENSVSTQVAYLQQNPKKRELLEELSRIENEEEANAIVFKRRIEGRRNNDGIRKIPVTSYSEEARQVSVKIN